MVGTVYRIEHHTTGKGCYQGASFRGGGLYAMSLQHSTTADEHPNPLNDDGIGRSPDGREYCAFESLESLREWFSDDELKMLHDNGFIIVKIEDVVITEIGDKQVLFLRSCYEEETRERIEFVPVGVCGVNGKGVPL